MGVFIGVDGGGTRTRAVVVDADGRELARAENDGAVVTVERPEEAANAVRRVVEAAAGRAGQELPVDVLWAGLAGAGTAAPRAAVTRALRRLDLAQRLIVGTDVEAAFYDAFGDGPGLLLIAGTGSVVWLRDAAGAERQIGGWGRTLGDEGSGYWIGLEGLRRLTWSADGRSGPTAMTGPLLEACGLDAVDDLVGWVERATKREVASLAPRVVKCADEGDPAATALVGDAVEHLGGMIRAAIVSLVDEPGIGDGIDPVDIVLWGGLVAAGGPLHTRVTREVEATGLRLIDDTLDPPVGAAQLARAAHQD